MLATQKPPESACRSGAKMKKPFLRPAPKPADVFIFVLVLAIALFLLKGTFSLRGDIVRVTANGTEYEFSAAEDGVFSVKGALGTTQFEIKDGRVRIISSPCPNKTCIALGFSDTLVCLPNNVIIQRISSAHGDEDFDAIAQ